MAGLPELLWCATPAEVAVLARHGRLRAAIVDALIARLDPGLLAVVRRACPVLVVDGRPDARRWEALGAVVLRETPPSATEALASVERAEASWRSAPGAAVKRLEPVRRGSLVAVLAAPGGSATPTAVAVAGSLAGRRAAPVSSGTLRTDNATFVVLVIATILVVALLTFVPALLLGPAVQGLSSELY